MIHLKNVKMAANIKSSGRGYNLTLPGFLFNITMTVALNNALTEPGRVYNPVRNVYRPLRKAIHKHIKRVINPLQRNK